jgi:RHS repeat-associated protein
MVDGYQPEVVSISDYYPFGMLEPGRNYNLSDDTLFRYGFNGKEDDNDIEGKGNSVDFGERIYDPRIGGWPTPDKMEPKFASWSPYSYGLDNPIFLSDINGLFPYPVTIRVFAPPTSLNGWGNDDDKRGFSASLNATSRISQTFVVDPTSQIEWGGIPRSPETTFHGVPVGNATNNTDEGKVDNTSYSGNGYDNGTATVNAHFSGSNPMYQGAAANIEVNSSVTISENDKAGYIVASVDLSSKQFPATEALITDPQGQTVWLAGAPAYGGPGSLVGADAKPVTSVQIKINIDGKTGAFKTVEYGGKKYTIAEWNKMATAKSAGPFPRDKKPN